MLILILGDMKTAEPQSFSIFESLFIVETHCVLIPQALAVGSLGYGLKKSGFVLISHRNNICGWSFEIPDIVLKMPGLENSSLRLT